jgi:hypothetical protein
LEASNVRKSYLPSKVRAISELREIPMRAVIMRAGASVSRRSRTQSQRKEG